MAKKITYPQKIILEDKLTPEQLDYSLQGIIIHKGDLSGGHYTSFAKKREKWVHFNDSR